MKSRVVLAAWIGWALARDAATAQPATLVQDIYPGASPGIADIRNLGGFIRSGNRIYFQITLGGSYFSNPELWSTDGTTAGTGPVGALSGDPNLPTGAIGSQADVNGTLFFAAAGGLWKTNGTPATTIRLVQTASPPFGLRNVGGTLFYLQCDYLAPCGVWKSDGTPAGTVLVSSLTAGPGSLYTQTGATG